MTSQEPVYSSGQIATLIGMSARKVTECIDSGDLAGFRLPTNGKDRRVRHKDLIEFIARHNIPVPGLVGLGRPRIVVFGDRDLRVAAGMAVGSALPLREGIVDVAPDMFSLGWSVRDGTIPVAVIIDFWEGSAQAEAALRVLSAEREMSWTKLIAVPGPEWKHPKDLTGVVAFPRPFSQHALHATLVAACEGWASGKPARPSPAKVAGYRGHGRHAPKNHA